MKLRRKYFWYISLLTVAIIVARYLIFSFSLNSLKPTIIHELEWLTDMDIEVDGDVRGKLLPRFSVVANNITLGYDEILEIEADRLEMEVPLLSLLSDRVILRGIRITRPEVTWEIESFDSSIPPGSAEGVIPVTEQDTIVWGVDLLGVEIIDGTFNYFDEYYQDTVICTGVYVASDSMSFKGAADTLRFEDVFAHGGLSIKHLRANSLLLENIELDIELGMGILETSYASRNENGLFRMDLSGPLPRYRIHQEMDSLNLARLLTAYEEESMISGYLDFLIELSFSGNKTSELWADSRGKLLVKGKNLTLYGIDLDIIAKKYERSQKFNLVDVSAVFLAGPVGLAVTKGTDFASLLISKRGDSTQVHEFISHWELHAGLLRAHDVAFSTNQNRIAVHGAINMWSQTFEGINFALVNEQGCAIFQQEVKGRFVAPEVSHVKVVKTLIGPLRNIFTGKKCKHPFYTGSVKHPVELK